MPGFTYDELKNIKEQAQETLGVQLTTFVESGTFQANTSKLAALLFDQTYSIELSDHFYQQAKKYESDKLHFIHGESFQVFQSLLPSLKQHNIFFWLDGHWSSGETARGSKDCPIIEELQVILQHTSQACLIAIDDVRLFGTHNAENWLDITEQTIMNVLKPSNRVREMKILNDRMYVYMKAI